MIKDYINKFARYTFDLVLKAILKIKRNHMYAVYRICNFEDAGNIAGLSLTDVEVNGSEICEIDANNIIKNVDPNFEVISDKQGDQLAQLLSIHSSEKWMALSNMLLIRVDAIKLGEYYIVSPSFDMDDSVDKSFSSLIEYMGGKIRKYHNREDEE